MWQETRLCKQNWQTKTCALHKMSLEEGQGVNQSKRCKIETTVKIWILRKILYKKYLNIYVFVLYECQKIVIYKYTFLVIGILKEVFFLAN